MQVLNIKSNQSNTYDSKGINFRAQKVARSSFEGATVGAAIVEAENSLEIVSLFVQGG